MDINTEKFGTTGLPKFGAGYAYGGTGAVLTKEGTALVEVDAAFNNLVTVVKKHCVTGNNLALWYFGFALQGIYGIALSVISGKPVANA